MSEGESSKIIFIVWVTLTSPLSFSPRGQGSGAAVWAALFDYEHAARRHSVHHGGPRLRRIDANEGRARVQMT